MAKQAIYKPTKQQHKILDLLYVYRFLNRQQLQSFLKRKYKQPIIKSLKYLRENNYLNWHYNPKNLATKNQPAIYYLSLGGIRYLRSQGYDPIVLRKRYREGNKKKPFIKRCMLLADCCLELSNNPNKYKYTLKQDLPEDLQDLNLDLLIKSFKDSKPNNTYLLEIITAKTPHYRINKRLKDYISYLNHVPFNTPLPQVSLILPSTAELIYTKRRAVSLLKQKGSYNQIFNFTTYRAIQEQGFTKVKWEVIELKER